MKKCLFILFLFPFFNVLGQNVPLLSWEVRYGCAIYVLGDSIGKGVPQIYQHTIFEKDFSDSYFGTDLKSDSISLLVGKELFVFYQKAKKKNIKNGTLGAYVPRKLFTKSLEKVKIKNLKILEIRNDTIYAEAKVKILKQHYKKSSLEKIKIPLKELNGVFIGPGKFWRGLMTGMLLAIIPFAIFCR